MVNSDIQFGRNPALLTEAETDDLLQQVSDQIAQNTFDPNHPQRLRQLVECLGDARGMTRLRVAETLGQIGQPAIPCLQEALSHHVNPVVRRAAAKTLTLIADPNSIPTLLQALFNDEDTVVKGSSVAALARMGAAAVPELLDILESPDHPSGTKGHAAWALAFIGADAQKYLYQALASDSSEVRAAVVGAIAKVAYEQPEAGGFEILINALDDSAEIVRCEAAAALGNLGHRPALPKLVELLRHPDWETRKSAALALMKIGDVQALAPLKTTRDQESETAVQKVIELAITQIEKHLT
ncbi:MAG: HEAT repeat domain-containing protein [Pseudanabaenales cyanobacterium]|nr:HEAT repeat domain-containing protein [Pseudanabaenales cyanobacterium]